MVVFWFKNSLAKPATSATLSFAGNEANFRTFQALSWDGTTHDLTEKEAMILKVLAEKPGVVITRDDLLEKVWGYEAFPSTRTVDNFILRLRKIAQDYDATDRIKVMNYLQERAAAGEVVTGLLYVNPDSQDLHEHMETMPVPLNTFGARDLCPGSVALEKINASMR